MEEEEVLLATETSFSPQVVLIFSSGNDSFRQISLLASALSYIRIHHVRLSYVQFRNASKGPGSL